MYTNRREKEYPQRGEPTKKTLEHQMSSATVSCTRVHLLPITFLFCNLLLLLLLFCWFLVRGGADRRLSVRLILKMQLLSVGPQRAAATERMEAQLMDGEEGKTKKKRNSHCSVDSVRLEPFVPKVQATFVGSNL